LPTDERLRVASLAPSDRLPTWPIARRLGVRLWTFLAGPTLDADLAAGVRPSSSPALSLRAHRITTPKARRRVAQALCFRIAAAKTPSHRFSARVPVDQGAVLSCQTEIRALAAHVATIERPRPQGVAIARQLAFDGLSPLYWKPNGGEDAATRLACTIQAAFIALDVSAEFF
jgi:hypothetical protein